MSRHRVSICVMLRLWMGSTLSRLATHRNHAITLNEQQPLAESLGRWRQLAAGEWRYADGDAAVTVAKCRQLRRARFGVCQIAGMGGQHVQKWQSIISV